MSNEAGGEKKGVVFKPGDKKLVEALRKRIDSDPNKYTQRYIGAQVGALTDHGTFSGSYVSTYLSKGWTGVEFEPALAEWLEQDKAERGRQRKDLFLRNPITDQVAMWLNYSISNGKCVALTGDAGIGKTETQKRMSNSR